MSIFFANKISGKYDFLNIFATLKKSKRFLFTFTSDFIIIIVYEIAAPFAAFTFTEGPL